MFFFLNEKQQIWLMKSKWTYSKGIAANHATFLISHPLNNWFAYDYSPLPSERNFPPRIRISMPTAKLASTN